MSPFKSKTISSSECLLTYLARMLLYAGEKAEVKQKQLFI